MASVFLRGKNSLPAALKVDSALRKSSPSRSVRVSLTATDSVEFRALECAEPPASTTIGGRLRLYHTGAGRPEPLHTMEA